MENTQWFIMKLWMMNNILLMNNINSLIIIINNIYHFRFEIFRNYWLYLETTSEILSPLSWFHGRTTEEALLSNATINISSTWRGQIFHLTILLFVHYSYHPNL